MDALTDHSFGGFAIQNSTEGSAQLRLQQQMQADALRPLASLDESDGDAEESRHVKEIFTSETIEEAISFLRLNVGSTLFDLLARCTQRFL